MDSYHTAEDDIGFWIIGLLLINCMTNSHYPSLQRNMLPSRVELLL